MELAQEELDARIESQVQEWSSNTNDCFTVELLRGDGSTAATFNPDFTYPIFGDEESIFGYHELSINLTFAAHNLRPHLGISYGKKFPASGDIRPTDIHADLRDFLPAAAFSNGSREDALHDEQAAEFTPPGEKVHEYARGGHRYEIWCSRLTDPAAKELLENMQVLVPMFIEGGSKLELEQDWTTQRWKLFLLYELRPKSASPATYSQYSLIGYATSYRVFTFPDRQKPLQSDLDVFLPSSQSVLDFLPPPQSSMPNDFAPTAMPNNMTSPLDLPSRERLSQFLILPPFQHEGHGRELYNAMYSFLTSASNIREFTVEDPSEAFDHLRDLCDLFYLRSHVPEFAALRINTTVSPAQLEAGANIPVDIIVPGAIRERIRAQTKIDSRQFDRLVEMHTLSFIPPLHRSKSRITRKDKSSNEDDKTYYFWRLYAKHRLYIFNRDQLAQLEREERVQRLESALDSVLEDYVKTLEKVQAMEQGADEKKSVNGDEAISEGARPRVRPRKRKIVDEAEEDEEGGAEDEDAEGVGEETGERVVAVNGHKKARVE